jgi:hypothetical protein
MDLKWQDQDDVCGATAANPVTTSKTRIFESKVIVPDHAHPELFH